MYTFDTPYRVRYADTDKMGFMYYGHYSKLYEIARVESLRSLGIRYKDMEDAGIIMPVVQNNSRYIAPAKYDDLLNIRLYLKKMPDRKVIFEYEIFNEEEILIHKGETILVFMDVAKQKVIDTPANVKDALKPFFEG
ncbi:acyl-CoA thioesterase [Jiulongibacter sp. NS-SX5]|uniref:acyl-CoA thioesterase n=1 Tax=Jiulongibacter sp. NS-SX5 TaxID=3463854 RepID=UPI0040595962